MDKAARDLQKANIPKRFQNSSIADYRVASNRGDPAALEETQHYIEELPDHVNGDGKGVLFLGKGGTGKTMLSCILARTAISKGFSAYYLTVAGYIKLNLQVMTLKDAWMAGNKEAMDEWDVKTKLIKDIRNSFQLLVLDDVGKEHTTSTRFAEDEIDFLLRYRFDMGLPTVMSSNNPISQWATLYSDSMESFIHEAFFIVPMTAKDYRREGTKGT